MKMHITMWSFFILLTGLLSKETTQVSAIRIWSSSAILSSQRLRCPERCGNVTIPFPFGIGKECYFNEEFEVSCDNNTAFIYDLSVQYISMDSITVDIDFFPHPYNKSSGMNIYRDTFVKGTSNEYFSFSYKNKFVAIGCDVYANVKDSDTGSSVSGCASYCHDSTNNVSSSSASSSYCTGNNGCCQSEFSKILPREITMSTQTMNMENTSWRSSNCTYYLLIEKGSSESDFTQLRGKCKEDDYYKGRMVLDWVIGNVSCDKAMSRPKYYACRNNSRCVNDTSRPAGGYRCDCSPGYQGNPYLLNGCQDDETVKYAYLTNIRRRVKPPLPAGYWGNRCVPIYVQLLAKDLINEPIWKAADAIKKSKDIITDEYVRSFIDFPELHYDEGITSGNRVSAFTDWQHVGHETVDFGWGGPVTVFPLSRHLVGSVEPCFFLPYSSATQVKKDGFKVLILMSVQVQKRIVVPTILAVYTLGTYRCDSNDVRHMLAKQLSIGIGAAITFVILVAVCLWLCKWLQKREENKAKQKYFKRNGGLLLRQRISLNGESSGSSLPKLFLKEELEKVTDNFNEIRILGKGGAGTVYKGMLSDGSIVAVKKSNAVDKDQIGQFINEILILSQINHRHIVKVLGCCLETQVPLLVYEYISNGTLSSHIHGNLSHSCNPTVSKSELDDQTLPHPAIVLSWDHLVRIAAEIAGALSYMHSCASTPILHRGIKSSNILLDDNFRPVVSDFGLSRLLSVDKTHLTILVGGTFGYIDPEYFRSGQLTDKCDVYAFGVILAELLTSQKIVTSNQPEDPGLVIHFTLSLKENRIIEIVDPEIVKEVEDEDVILAVAKLAKRCLNFNARRRPSKKEVAAELEKQGKMRQDLPHDESFQDNILPESESSCSHTSDCTEEDNQNPVSHNEMHYDRKGSL